MEASFHSERAPEPVGKYPHARRVGHLLFLSGVGPRARGTSAIPGVEPHDIEAQCRSVFANVRAILEESGSSWDRLVDVTVYLTDMKRDFAIYNRLWAEYFPTNPPCRTTLEIGALPTPISIELKCVATLPETTAGPKAEPPKPRSAGSPLNLKRWIDEHRDSLKPPVGNQMVWEDREFWVTVVGGPNARTDFHVNESEEFFYQVEGDVTLRVMEEGKPRDIAIREGDIYLLPPGVPHSPQRPAGTVGVVLERKRLAHERDRLQWYCSGCNGMLYEEVFYLANIVTQFKPVFERFYSSVTARTCQRCGIVHPAPQPKGTTRGTG